MIARSAGSGAAAIVVARSSASASRSSAGTVRSAMPQATASSADSHGDVNSTSAARCQPMRAGNSRLLAASGGTPISANGVRNRASSAARTMSQWGSNVNPMPTAAPLTAASSGLSNACSASSSTGKPDSIFSPPTRRAISSRSCPAENARPAPVTTTTFTASSARAASSASPAAR